ncbi:MAG: DUF2971 domain-containing protein [Phycisphaerae bacterium]|jgi:hypothetical protein
MILYKYRSLANFEHVLDIILNQRLYCSTYPELNDPFEGIFETRIHSRMISIQSKSYQKAEDFFEGEIDKIKICSLSSDLNDVRLWPYYADGHKGIVLGIDFSELERIYEVKYPEKLPSSGWWDYAIALGGPSIHIDNIYEILSHKTKHWEFESEHRIIDESKYLEEGKYFNIKDRIKAIYLGTRTSDKYRDLLKQIVQDKIPFWTTKINHEKVIVEPDKLVEG